MVLKSQTLSTVCSTVLSALWGCLKPSSKQAQSEHVSLSGRAWARSCPYAVAELDHRDRSGRLPCCNFCVILPARVLTRTDSGLNGCSWYRALMSSASGLYAIGTSLDFVLKGTSTRTALSRKTIRKQLRVSVWLASSCRTLFPTPASCCALRRSLSCCISDPCYTVCRSQIASGGSIRSP